MALSLARGSHHERRRPETGRHLRNPNRSAADFRDKADHVAKVTGSVTR